MSKKRSRAVAASEPDPPDDRLQRPVSLSFRYYEVGGAFCLSHCTQGELRDATDCLRQLTTLSWQQVTQSGGKGDKKAGLGSTRYQNSDLHGVTRPPGLASGLPVIGVRASQRFRIFGIYAEHVFHVLWFDRGHAIVPV